MQPDAAPILLKKAREDEYLPKLAVNDSKVSDEQIGFLSQQAVEKAIKAVLSHRRVQYRRTHDLTELFDLLAQNSIDYPRGLAASVILTPFAAEFRYDYLPPEMKTEKSFDRAAAIQFIRTALEWAERVVAGIA